MGGLCQWTWPRRHRSGCYSVYSVHGVHGACQPGKRCDPEQCYFCHRRAGRKRDVRRAAARLLLDTNRVYRVRHKDLPIRKVNASHVLIFYLLWTSNLVGRDFFAITFECVASQERNFGNGRFRPRPNFYY